LIDGQRGACNTVGHVRQRDVNFPGIPSAVDQQIKKRKMGCRTLRQPIKYLVPEAGIEPARSEEQGFLTNRNRSTITIGCQK
jgi:hypothetical protein